MFGRRCTLCGGKLDSRNICRECGLDNSKSDKNYKINQSSCDHMPLTHVHEETGEARREAPKKASPAWEVRRDGSAGQRARQEKRSYPGTKEKKGGCGGCLVKVFLFLVLLSVVGTLIGSIGRWISSRHSDSGSSSDGYRNPYQNLEEELPADGEPVQYALEKGEYIVGVHIPAGNYVAETEDSYDVVEVQDYERGLYLYEYSGLDGEDYLDDLRLFDGAMVKIDTETVVTLSSQNGQTDSMHGTPNPLTEDVSLRVDEQPLTAGKDFAAGVYDLRISGGYGNLNIKIQETDGQTYTQRYWYFQKGGGTVCRNIVLPEGAQICTDDGGQLSMILKPSAVIESADYLEYYKR